MSRTSAWIVVGLVLACGCQGAGVGPRTGMSPRPIPPAVRAARMRLRAYDTDGALALLEHERALGAGEPERAWLLVHLLSERSEATRARKMAEGLPGGTFRIALLASLAEDPVHGLEEVRQALRRTEDPWLRLTASLLHLVREDAGPAEQHARRILGGTSTFLEVEARLLIARALAHEGRLGEASLLAESAARMEPSDTRAWFIAADAARRAGAFERAVRMLTRTMASAPAAEGPPRRLAELLRQLDDPDRYAEVRESLRTLAPAQTNPERAALAGLVAEEQGRPEEAIRHYEHALSRGADPIPLERDLRRLLTRRGSIRRVAELLLGCVPPDVRRDPGNLVRAHWATIEQATRNAPRSADERLALARALVGVGALDEALGVLRGASEGRERDLVSRVERHQRFVNALEALLEEGYRKGDRKEDSVGFPATLRALGDLARRHLSADEARAFADVGLGLRSVPLVGTWLDHGTDTTSPVVAHFRRYGTYMVIGQRSGQPVEAVLLSVGSLTRDQVIRTRGHCFRQDVAVGYDRRLRSFHTALGGDLGGACLPDGIWMDADSTRSLEHDLRRASTRDRGWLRRVQRSPRELPLDTADGPFALGTTAGAGVRLALRYATRQGDDPWGSFETLRAHEFGHLVEIRRHLPIARGLPATAGLLASSGLALSGLEMEVERRAQIAAVAESRHPDLALAEMLVALPVRSTDPGPHAAGYEQALAQFVRYVWHHPEAFPNIDRRFRILPQFDRLTNGQIRAIARALLPP